MEIEKLRILSLLVVSASLAALCSGDFPFSFFLIQVASIVPLWFPIDLVALISVIMGISIVLIPVIGLTARFALKPTVEALGRFFEARGTEESIALMERRMALLEQHVEVLESSLHRIEEVSDFHAQLKAPASDAAEATE